MPAIASSGDGLGTEINRFQIVEGRRADPDDPDEVVVAFQLAEDFDVGLGDEIPVFDPDSILDEIESAPPEAVPPEERAALLELYREAIEVLPDGAVTVVGIEASPGEFPPSLLPAVHFTPAFDRLDGPNDGAELLAVRLEDGEADVAAFRERSRPGAAAKTSRSPPRPTTLET